jgi:hypothetical protein
MSVAPCSLSHYDPNLTSIPELPTIFRALESTILIVQRTIQRFFPSVTALSQFVADMGARAFVSPALFVRIAWRQAYPGVKFDIENPIQRLQIKDMYLVYGYDWTIDPMFIKYPI